MARIGVIYYGKCNYVLIDCIRRPVRGEFIRNYVTIFSFLLIRDKNLRLHTGWPVEKPVWIRRGSWCETKSIKLIICSTKYLSLVWSRKETIAFRTVDFPRVLLLSPRPVIISTQLCSTKIGNYNIITVKSEIDFLLYLLFSSWIGIRDQLSSETLAEHKNVPIEVIQSFRKKA